VFPANTLVELVATPAAGSTFLGWIGACTGSGSCMVAMNAEKEATATFAPAGIDLIVVAVSDPPRAVAPWPRVCRDRHRHE
jgi:hypothetical protein